MRAEEAMVRMVVARAGVARGAVVREVEARAGAEKAGGCKAGCRAHMREMTQRPGARWNSSRRR